jgi:hypothetical protein
MGYSEGRCDLEVTMKIMTIATVIATLTTGAAYAAEMSAPSSDSNGTCLWNYNIVKTDVAPDERSITFHMKDGKTWVNTLPAACHGLNLHGFSYVSRTSNEVCAGQGIQLVQSGTVCSLGQFEPGPTQQPAQQY